MLYKDEEDMVYKVDVSEIDGKVRMIFSCNGGKFGTDEILDMYHLSPKELLRVLQKNYLLEWAGVQTDGNS